MKDYKVDKESFSDSFRKEVYEVISQIPVGKVSTYGGIALLLGVPQCSRMVGRALKEFRRKAGARMGGTKTTLAGRRNCFQG